MSQALGAGVGVIQPDPTEAIVVGHGDTVMRWRNLAPNRRRHWNGLRFAAAVLGMYLSEAAHQYNE
jgi:hypothetical protein